MVYLQYVLSDAVQDSVSVQKPYRSGYKHMVSLQYVLSDAIQDTVSVQNTYHSGYKHMISLQYVLSDAVRDCFCEKDISQWLQAYGFSPVCAV